MVLENREAAELRKIPKAIAAFWIQMSPTGPVDRGYESSLAQLRSDRTSNELKPCGRSWVVWS
jgi:hypothetical protein